VKHEIPSERCGEAGGHRRAGAVDGPEGRSRKGRMGKEEDVVKTSGGREPGFIVWPNLIGANMPQAAVHRYAV